jgi:hypothetical protein
MRNIDPAYKLSTSIKIAMLYLEDDDPVNAELYIKKASALIASTKVGAGVMPLSHSHECRAWVQHTPAAVGWHHEAKPHAFQ